MATHVLGISAFYHDSAAALLRDGELVAAVQQERFSRIKHDPAFPADAIAWCLHHAAVPRDGIDALVFYEKPLTTFVRLLRGYAAAGPAGFRSFRRALPVWLRQKLWIPYEIDKGLRQLGYVRPDRTWFVEHHESHAASAFYPSPFESAAVLTFDGVGEWATSSVGVGHGNRLDLHQQIDFPHSLGLLYSAFTHYCGFRVNSGEYKLMGLAPYGQPRYVDTIKDHLIDCHQDGSFTLDLSYFDYLTGLEMTNERFAALFGGPPRRPETELTARHADLAASIQAVTEQVVLAMANHARRLTGQSRACLAGGVALNCVANGRLLREGPFDEIWIQPAAGDAGGAVGAAYLGWYRMLGHERAGDGCRDSMAGACLGPSFGSDEIAGWLRDAGYPARRIADPGKLAAAIAALIDDGHIIGLLQGAMEFGPRALGHRSILGDARSPGMQAKLNLEIKYRESFRPFAPAVLEERCREWFDLDTGSPYMMLTAPLAEPRRRSTTPPTDRSDFRSWVNQVRSEIPAVSHVDGSARIQTVGDHDPAFAGILRAFEDRSGCPVLINTSFNVRGEPIVCSPTDAYRCFMRTGMDVLVLEDHILMKQNQPDWPEPLPSSSELALD